MYHSPTRTVWSSSIACAPCSPVRQTWSSSYCAPVAQECVSVLKTDFVPQEAPARWAVAAFENAASHAAAAGQANQASGAAAVDANRAASEAQAANSAHNAAQH